MAIDTNGRASIATRPLRQFVVGAAFDSFGTGMSAVAVILYFVTVVGLRADTVASIMSLAAAVGLLAPVPIGAFADRVGLRTVYCTVLVFRGAGYVAFAFVHDLVPFAAAALAAISFETTTSSLQQSLVGKIAPGKSRVRAMSYVRAARNIAFAGGTLVASIALGSRSAAAVSALFVANGVSFILLAVIVGSIRETRAAPEESSPRERQNVEATVKGDEPVWKNRRYLLLSGLNGIIALHDSIFLVFLPIWSVSVLHTSPGAPPLFITINTGLTFLFQIFFAKAKGLDGATGGFLIATLIGVVGACILCMAAAASHGALILVCLFSAVVLLTFGENCHSVAGWCVSFELAPNSRRTEYLAAFNMSSGVQRAVGPVFMTSVLLTRGTTGWLAFILLYATATGAFWLIARRPLRDAGRSGNQAPAS